MVSANKCIKPINPLQSRGNYSATSNNYEVGTLAVDGWAVTFGTLRKGLGGAPACPGPFSLYQMYSFGTHSSTASVPITVLLYNGLLCGFNVGIKELSNQMQAKVDSLYQCRQRHIILAIVKTDIQVHIFIINEIAPFFY